MSNTSPLGLFVEAVYSEALRLIEELAEFIARERGPALGHLSPATRLLLIRETSRMTRDLMDIMAWLLMEKAVASGEVESDDTTRLESFRLRPLAAARAPLAELQELPLAARGLIDRCRRIHARALEVERLISDQRAAENAVPPVST
jgi:regulator of CtrA degradation